MFIKTHSGEYINLEHVDKLRASVTGHVYARTAAVIYDEQEEFPVAEFGTKEAAHKWLDELIEKLNAEK